MKDKKAYANVKTIIQGKITNQETAVNRVAKVLDDVLNLWDKDKKYLLKVLQKTLHKHAPKV